METVECYAFHPSFRSVQGCAILINMTTIKCRPCLHYSIEKENEKRRLTRKAIGKVIFTLRLSMRGCASFKHHRTLSMTPNQSSFCPINMRISMRLVTRLASRVIARVLLPLPCFRVEGRKYSLSMESSFHFWLLNFALCVRRFNQFFRKQHNLIRVF